VSKKIKKPEKPKKNNRKNLTVKKNQLNRLKFWKNRPVRVGFGFISLKLKNRTEHKPKKRAKQAKNRAKPEKTESNRFEPVFVLKNRNQNRSFWTSFGFLKKKWFDYFFYKNQIKSRMTPPSSNIWLNMNFNLNFKGKYIYVYVAGSRY